MPRKKVIKKTIEETLEEYKKWNLIHLSNLEYQREEQIRKKEEEEKRKCLEFSKKNVILMLDIHRKFAKICLWGNKPISPEMCLRLGVAWIEEFSIDTQLSEKDKKIIDYTTFARLMTTDRIICSHCEDVKVYEFSNNLIRIREYKGNDLEWNISMIDIDILFNELRENQFIAHDTPRNVFFEIFNPNLQIFENPIEWKDIKELVYFLDKCRDWEIIANTKYQSLIERYKMFKTQNSKGNYLKSNSIRTTLSDLKNGILETEKFKLRALLIDNFSRTP